MNAYAYCGNDPVNWIDPSGRWFISPAVMVGLGAVALAAGIGGVSLAVQDETLRAAIVSAAIVPLVVGAGLLGNALYHSRAAGKLGSFLKGIGRTRNGPATNSGAVGWKEGGTPSFMKNLKRNVYLTDKPDAGGRHQMTGIGSRDFGKGGFVSEHELLLWSRDLLTMKSTTGRLVPRVPKMQRSVNTDIRTGGQRSDVPLDFQY